MDEVFVLHFPEHRAMYTPLAVVSRARNTAPHDANADVSSKEGAVIVRMRNCQSGSALTSGTGINDISIKLKQ
jgi:hypothetical protein